MPPKSKFTKEQIISAAYGLVEREGYEALTARALGAELGSSARPVFTVFANMDEVHRAVIDEAKARYKRYVDDLLKQTPAFKGAGTAYIKFACEMPQLFRLLFMRDGFGSPELTDVLGTIDDNADRILRSITDSYDVSEEQARKLYLQMWLFSHGIATATVTKLCVFSASEVSDMLTDMFKAAMLRIKTEGGEK